MSKPVKPEIVAGSLPPLVIEELKDAKATLEHHGIAERLTALIGAPINASIRFLPAIAEDTIHKAIDKSLHIALDVALKTLGDSADGSTPKLMRHKIMAGISGAAGGALGGATAAAELPVSTVLILRSVADIARSQGENLNDVNSRLACLEVFAFDPGKASDQNSNTEFGYFAVRAAMAKHVADASKYVVNHRVIDAAAPPLARLIGEISKRFGVVVSQKLAAQAIPVIGALGGALINSYFIDHYQDLARAHFTIRRLQRQYGDALIREAYGNSTDPEELPVGR